MPIRSKNLLVVCHGNINRSPLCAAVLARALPDWTVNQAGLKDAIPLKGERAAKKMRDAAALLGYDLEAHRSHRIRMEEFDAAVWVVYMDAGNLKRLHWFHKVNDDRYIPLGRYADPIVKRIPDPAFMRADSQEFVDVVALIVGASLRLAEALRKGEDGKCE